MRFLWGLFLCLLIIGGMMFLIAVGGTFGMMVAMFGIPMVHHVASKNFH